MLTRLLHGELGRVFGLLRLQERPLHARQFAPCLLLGRPRRPHRLTGPTRLRHHLAHGGASRGSRHPLARDTLRPLHIHRLDHAPEALHRRPFQQVCCRAGSALVRTTCRTTHAFPDLFNHRDTPN